jgi:hypothetical protein
VTKVERNPADTFATVEARPLAQLERDREVLLLWPSETKPADPQPAAIESPSTPETLPSN